VEGCRWVGLDGLAQGVLTGDLAPGGGQTGHFVFAASPGAYPSAFDFKLAGANPSAACQAMTSDIPRLAGAYPALQTKSVTGALPGKSELALGFTITTQDATHLAGTCSPVNFQVQVSLPDASVIKQSFTCAWVAYAVPQPAP
jgi:hypothetical protein